MAFVIIIYGGIVYKFFNEKTSVPVENEITPPLKIDGLTGKQNNSKGITINLEDRDPFLDQINSTEKYRKPKVLINSSTKSIKRKMKSTNMEWPLIKYFGFLKLGNSEKVAVLKLDKKVYRLSLNEERQGVQLTKIWGDSIELVKDRSKKVVKKN